MRLKKSSVVIVLNMEAVLQLESQGCIKKCELINLIPDSFKEVVHLFMEENIGFKTEPVFCLSRLNGEPVSLSGEYVDEEFSVIDFLPVETGDVILEFSVEEDTMVSIGVERLFELKQYYENLDGMNETVLQLLRDSLCVGAEVEGEKNVYSFLPCLYKKDCRRYFRIDDNWDKDRSELFTKTDDIIVAQMGIF